MFLLLHKYCVGMGGRLLFPALIKPGQLPLFVVTQLMSISLAIVYALGLLRTMNSTVNICTLSITGAVVRVSYYLLLRLRGVEELSDVEQIKWVRVIIVLILLS
jgi:Na+/pantothenate symporter